MVVEEMVAGRHHAAAGLSHIGWVHADYALNACKHRTHVASAITALIRGRWFIELSEEATIRKMMPSVMLCSMTVSHTALVELTSMLNQIALETQNMPCTHLSVT